MRVSSTESSQVQPGETTHAKRTQKTQETKEAKETRAKGMREVDTSGAEGARPEISSRAREFATAKAAAGGAPDVREEKIAELKRRIAAGSYKVDSDKVADKMVEEHLQTSGMS